MIQSDRYYFLDALLTLVQQVLTIWLLVELFLSGRPVLFMLAFAIYTIPTARDWLYNKAHPSFKIK